MMTRLTTNTDDDNIEIIGGVDPRLMAIEDDDPTATR